MKGVIQCTIHTFIVKNKEYSRLKQTIIDILNGDDEQTDIEKLKCHIHLLYELEKSNQVNRMNGLLLKYVR